MCHGQIISERLQRARRQRHCDQCGEPIAIGKRRHVLAVKGGGDFWQNEYCLTCSALLDAAPRDYEGCALDDRRDQRDLAQHDGWRALLAKCRAAKANIVARLTKEKEAHRGEG